MATSVRFGLADPATCCHLCVAALTLIGVPRYEFRCRECSTTFEVSRPMHASGDPASCPCGHTDTITLMSRAGLARNGGSTAPAPLAAARSAASGGGCCGGGCCG
jgi:putative FmdB family regulatory protein